MISIVNTVLCILTITTSAYRCPQETLQLTFDPDGIIFPCATTPSFKHHHRVNIRAVCWSGTDEMIDQKWVVCEDPYGQCVTMSCNTTKGLYLRSNMNEDHRLVISEGTQIGGIEMTVMTPSSQRSWRFLQEFSAINDTLGNDTNTTECSDYATCLSGTIPNIIPSEWTKNPQFDIHSTQISGT
eukprot:PhF_6_TR18896/c0_g1_i3/m.27537